MMVALVFKTDAKYLLSISACCSGSVTYFPVSLSGKTFLP